MFDSLSAGDILDSSIRSYRRNFWTLVKISAPPILAAAAGMVVLGIGWKGSSTASKSESLLFYSVITGIGALLWLVGNLSTMMVMGAAARSLVRHLLLDEPIKVGDTYKAFRQRFWGLLWAVLLITLIFLVVTPIAFYIWLFVAILTSIGAALLVWVSGGLAFFIGILLNVAVGALCLYLYFLVIGKFAYVPQALMVEGVTATKAISRSISLAKKNSWRLTTMVLFSIFAVYSVATLLIVPIGWYAWANGIEMFSFGEDLMPEWVLIVLRVTIQLSMILLSPILMMGLSIMYLDERVRLEGYDIELLAARNLGEVPSQYNSEYNPLKPALVALSEENSSAAKKNFLPLSLK